MDRRKDPTTKDLSITSSQKILEASQKLGNAQKDFPYIRGFYDIPIEIWCKILDYATLSHLFPHSEQDPDHNTSSISILHQPFLFGVTWDRLPHSIKYTNNTVHVGYRERIKRLRLVCHRWNEIMNRYIAPLYRAMFLSDTNPGKSQRRPWIILLTEYKYNYPKVDYSDYDLADVRIAVLKYRRNTFILAELLHRLPLLRALSINSDELELFHPLSLTSKLTHLHLSNIGPSDLRYTQLALPNLHYLSLHLLSSFFGKEYIYAPYFSPNWKLERLNYLSIAAENIPQWAEDALSALFRGLSSSGSNMVSELRFDFRSGQKFWAKAFWECIWKVWFPHLTVLGCPPRCVSAVISSLLSPPVYMPHRQRISLFILDKVEDESWREEPPQDRNLGEVYRAGRLERIYVPSSELYSDFIKVIIRYCIEYKIPVYDAETQRALEASRPWLNMSTI
jgi:hypothetical protein